MNVGNNSVNVVSGIPPIWKKLNTETTKISFQIKIKI